MTFSHALLVTSLVAMFPMAANASTLPRVDFQKGDRILAGGLLDVNFDYALTDRLSLGVSLIPSPSTSISWYDPVLSPMSVAVRSTFRIGELFGASVGVTLGGGAFMVIPEVSGVGGQPLLPGTPFFRFETAAFIQPALDVALPLGSGDDHWTLRATLGPSFVLDPDHRKIIPLWPNIELARSFGPHGELTLLGNALVGWRNVF
jgi:hypothetical protein